ncbi:MAG: hypothetical protein A2268_13960 [Candidatus Raymondbacteria bacterium RifOxyA12_full_50_37]|uniref:Uncharacterized protein n=1 Tax=Candidatus Raymondbacteria bacterium RIFOXYD12_FULL_49_13 TaxID=1817890 RepID=A0A1F7FKP4_UNCRA|nr:MAG: hypothetical protein A2268_13960 [Candidatus Raymondbacteria bacterium RifOxyA12_full_50_37]OGJ88184.1 MAG: hypothetical protein A2248_19300 [Candidatus Raymondbacteria bacterium RIFOXYA2_FULL_49_16]OGJ98123.1 MAG: hypothetical protein A2350_00160 [Candidatus Raymondbacteria bacterium RifOxyB12_full_50_8]OGK01842.1 MAG: hypothetical protein A2487_14345 [Candidatus Raymondbacteria bacterium RifOxyC12_full_50_8]OGK07230.1 MAG: hypothetical protein A2519_13965 [Candidatus Raymondbacteria b
MKERTERMIELGFIREPDRVVAEIEKAAAAMHRDGWVFLHTRTDPDLNTVVLVFEKELEN